MEQRPSPAAIVDDFGRFRFGTYTTPIFTPDFAPARISGVSGFIGKPHRRGLGGWLRAMRMKEWQHFWLVSEEFLVVAGIAQLGFVGNAFCRVIERDTGECHLFERIIPFGKTISFSPSSVRGSTSWRDGSDHMTFEYQTQDGGLWSCTFNLPFGAERLKGQVSVHAEPECLALVFPLDSNRAAYTHKEAGNRVEGLVTLGFRELRFEHDGQGAIDWTRGYLDRHTRWNWLSGAGVTGDGRRLGINLSEHVYGAAENAVWLDGVMHMMGPVTFARPKHPQEPWRITSDKVALEFHPDTSKTQCVDYWLVQSDFTQHYGVIEGHLRFAGGMMQVNGLYGVCEVHEAVW